MKHIDLLGKNAKDKVTGFEGVVTTMSYDLYGCIQAIITPPANKDGKKEDSHWFDVARLEVSTEDRVMPVPDFESGPIAEGRKGPQQKPAGR